jgi:signal transduction histidine kinase
MEHQQFSNWINKSSLPRAIADFSNQRFIAWNTAFLERTGYSEARIKAIKPEEIIVLSDSRFPLPNDDGQLSAEFIVCAVKTISQSAALPGHVAKSAGRFGYVMLHDAESDSAEFEQGRLMGQQEERARIVKLFHDEVSSTMMAALFAVEAAKNALDAQNLPEVQELEKASELLSEAVERTADVLEGRRNSGTGPTEGYPETCKAD